MYEDTVTTGRGLFGGFIYAVFVLLPFFYSFLEKFSNSFCSFQAILIDLFPGAHGKFLVLAIVLDILFLSFCKNM